MRFSPSSFKNKNQSWKQRCWYLTWFTSSPSAKKVIIGKHMKLVLFHTLLHHCFLSFVTTCYFSVNHSYVVPTLCIYLSDFYFYRHSLGIRHWHFGWWMLRCIPTWVFCPLLLRLLIVEYSFIKWFDSLLMHLVEKATSISWVSMNLTHIQSMFKMLTNITYA